MGKSKGFGFIAMDDPEDVQRAIRHMHGRDWEGRRLNVELCRQVTPYCGQLIAVAPSTSV
eukprot:1147588-Pelagomonas_calceolata.AAC.2